MTRTARAAGPENGAGGPTGSQASAAQADVRWASFEAQAPFATLGVPRRARG